VRLVVLLAILLAWAPPAQAGVEEVHYPAPFDGRPRRIWVRTPAVPAESAGWILCTGYDQDGLSGESYTTNLPLARAIEDDVLLVHTWEGKPLPREHGGPCRMITPKLYAWKGTKWIRRIEFLDRNRKGFWERRGYSDTAEPWFEDRYSS